MRKNLRVADGSVAEVHVVMTPVGAMPVASGLHEVRLLLISTR